MKHQHLLAGERLRVSFWRAADRIEHRVEVASGEGSQFVAVLESPGSADGDPAWPAAPPLQQLHFEERPSGARCALLVGMQGKGHWSAAIEARSEGEIAFDVACRASAQPAWLGTTYRLLAPAAFPRQADPMEPVPVDGLTLPGGWQLRATAPHSRLLVDAARGVLRIEAAVPATSDQWPRTIRWQYAIQPAP